MRLTHICVSDLHFGADTAILAYTPGFSANRLRQSLAVAMNTMLDFLNRGEDQPNRPSLILLGDIMAVSIGTRQSRFRVSKSS